MSFSLPLISSGRAFAVKTACTFSGVPEKKGTVERGRREREREREREGEKTEERGGWRQVLQVITGNLSTHPHTSSQHTVHLCVGSGGGSDT